MHHSLTVLQMIFYLTSLSPTYALVVQLAALEATADIDT